MTKRNMNLNSETMAKKQKLDDLADLWGEDLNVEAVEDCFERASQLYQERNKADESFLPSYSGFKDPNVFISSTQADADVNLQIKRLQEKCKEKEGEVSILRSNLKDVKAHSQTDLERRESEWKEKINTAQKKNVAIQSELQFKNLEVANLKQKIGELSKLVNNLDQSQAQPSFKPTQGNSNITVVKDEIPLVINVNTDLNYPLKNKHFNFLFELSEEVEYEERRKFNLTKSTIPYLQNQIPFEIEENATLKLPDGKYQSFNTIYPEILDIINLSSEEINSQAIIAPLKKVLEFSFQLLKQFQNMLHHIEKISQTRGNTLNNCKHLMPNKQRGCKAAKMLRFLSELSPFSTQLQNHLISPDSSQIIPNLDILNIILDIVTSIGNTGEGGNCSMFLSAVVKLLGQLCMHQKKSIQVATQPVIFQIIKAVLFSRPESQVIYHISYFLNVTSDVPDLVDFLCSNSKNTKKKYFSRDTCGFHMFAVMTEHLFVECFDNESEQSILPIGHNILTFVYNIFKADSSWLHQQNECECLCQLYKLVIGIIYRNLQKVGPNNKHTFSSFLKKAIKIFTLLTFNSYDLIQKYITDFAEYKEIINSLSRLSDDLGFESEDLADLEKLNLSEEHPDITISSFTDLDF